MNKVCIILIALGLAFQVNAQFRLPREMRKSQNDSVNTEKKVDYSFSTGTSFFSSPGYAKGSVFYIAPEFKLKLSPKFKVDAGIMLMQNRFSYSNPTSLFGERSVVVKSGPAYDGVAYATGNYTVNSKLTFTGSLVKSFSPDGSPQDVGWQNSFQMMSLGVNYKLTEHMSIGGGVRFIQSNGFNPYSGYNSMYPGSFGTSNSFNNPTF